MRFVSFDLIAFGPFTNVKLDLSGGKEGVHLIYGPNEAGKSVALRAINSFLFGIPARTIDNFRHENNALRIGASLRHSDGTESAFIRRKGNKNTVLDLQGNTVDEGEISRYVAGMSRDVFESMYGLDAEKLVEGGQDIIKGRGEVGTTLFSAAAGISNLQDILKSTETRQEELFKSRGTTPKVNRLIRELNDLKKRRKELSLSVREWEEVEHKITEFEEQGRKLKEDIGEKSAAWQCKQRQFDVIEDAGEFHEINRELALMGEVILLPDNFTEKRKRTEEKLFEDNRAFENARKAFKDLNVEIDLITVPRELLSEKEKIAELLQDSGNYKQGQGQLPRLQAEALQTKRACKRVLRELNIQDETGEHISYPPKEDFSKYCLTIKDSANIEELCDDHSQIKSDLDHHSKTLVTHKNNIEKLRKKLGKIPEPEDASALQRTLNEGRGAGLNDRKIGDIERETEIFAEEVKNGLRRLDLNKVNFEEFLGLTIPKKKTVNGFSTRFQKIEQRRLDLERRNNKEKKELETIEDNIREMKAESAIPTEEDLFEIRKLRDRIWQTIREAWLDEKTVSDNEWQVLVSDAHSLQDAYEKSVKKSDETSDRLRHESEHVARLTQLVSRRDLCQKRIGEIDRDEKLLQADIAVLKTEWKEAWKPVTSDPGDPEEMREWSDQYDDVMRQCKQWKQKTIEFDNAEKRISELKTRLVSVFKELGVNEVSQEYELDTLYSEADMLIKKQTTNKATREQLISQIREFEGLFADEDQKVNELKKSYGLWTGNWAEAVARIKLDSDVTPRQAKAVLTKFRELSDMAWDVEKLESRIRAIESDGRRFRKNIEKLCSDLHHPTEGIEHERIIEQLNRELSDALTQQARLQGLEGEKMGLEKNLSELEDRINGNTIVLKKLCESAGCEKVEDLPVKEAQSRDYQKKKARLNELMRIISRATGGVDLEQFLNELKTVDADSLPTKIDELSWQIEQLKKEISDIDRKIGGLKNEQEKMGGGQEAANVAEHIEQVIAEIREAAEEYAKLVLATSAMREAAERYRQENQSIVLQKASDLFSRVTLKSFDGLTIDYDDTDQPILVGTRQGKKLQVEAMSDGTCDQLYLALRLASLEQHFKSREPVPFILDDVLVNFDDTRAGETLKMLGELSHLTQIILFTHHKHIREIAEKSLSADILYVSEL
jgi:uncharacterized protein YhaN